MNTLTLGSLFDGSGGFPLAGALNGITPIWASEVEPYPIAVTCSRSPPDVASGECRGGSRRSDTAGGCDHVWQSVPGHERGWEASRARWLPLRFIP